MSDDIKDRAAQQVADRMMVNFKQFGDFLNSAPSIIPTWFHVLYRVDKEEALKKEGKRIEDLEQFSFEKEIFLAWRYNYAKEMMAIFRKEVTGQMENIQINFHLYEMPNVQN